MAVPLLKQVAGGIVADQLMIRRDAVQPHLPIAAVDQHAGLVQIGGQGVDMLVVDADDQRRFGVRIAHLFQKQRAVAVLLFQPAVADAHLMLHQRGGNALNDLVVEDVGAYVERALRREHHHVVQHQPAAGNALQNAVLLRTVQHLAARLGAGVGLARQHAGNGADRQPGLAGDLLDFQLSVHFVISFKFVHENIFTAHFQRLDRLSCPLWLFFHPPVKIFAKNSVSLRAIAE